MTIDEEGAVTMHEHHAATAQEDGVMTRSEASAPMPSAVAGSPPRDAATVPGPRPAAGASAGGSTRARARRGANSTRRNLGRSVPVVVVAAALLAACGSGAASSGSTTTTRPPVSSTTTTTTAGGSGGPGSGGAAVTYGIDVNQFDNDIGPARVPQVLGLIEKAGARAVRIGGVWASAEPQPGHFDWSGVDKIFSLAAQDHLTVLFEMGNEPAWDAPGGNTNAPPVDCTSPTASCASVDQYVRALVSHAAGEGLRYLIARNEPQNFDKNWVGGTAGAYARFQQVVYQAAHAVDPQIQVLNGGTEQASAALEQIEAQLQPPTPYAQQAAAFAHDLYTNPAWCDSIDVLDVHVGDHGPRYSPEVVDDSEAALESCNGGRHLPVWVTEVGYTSIPALQDWSVYRSLFGSQYEGGETGQAAFLTDTLTALAKDPNVIGIDWTFMIDPNQGDTLPPGMSDHQAVTEGAGAGLATANYQTKASYQAFENVAAAHQ